MTCGTCAGLSPASKDYSSLIGKNLAKKNESSRLLMAADDPTPTWALMFSPDPAFARRACGRILRRRWPRSGDDKGQDDLGDVEVSAAEKRVALVDQIQNRSHNQ